MLFSAECLSAEKRQPTLFFPSQGNLLLAGASWFEVEGYQKTTCLLFTEVLLGLIFALSLRIRTVSVNLVGSSNQKLLNFYIGFSLETPTRINSQGE